MNKFIIDIKEELKELLHRNLHLTRTVRSEAFIDKNIVSVFDSNLTRSLGMSEDEVNPHIVIVKVYYFDVAQNIIKNGFVMNGEKYKFFSASAGQIRTKKFVAVQEKLLNQCWNSLTCGLTIDKINSLGGVNVNKFLAYLALCNSATDLWEDFDIDRTIVVDDFETKVRGTVDFISDKTYKITRQEMSIPIAHTDGCGMILSSLSKKNFMCRMPWVKGLLAVFPFDKFIREANKKDPKINHGVIKDIYGKEYDILRDDIQIIFTKSQFKMWKYFESWDEYKTAFKMFNCSAGKCNVEEDEFEDAKINYQMIQTLTDISKQELVQLCNATIDKLSKMSHDKDTMLKSFGATECNYRKNSFQECLLLYPELLQEKYCVETLKDIKKSSEKDAWSAKLDINGKYTFIIPDLYAFCEYLFLGIENPVGLLKDKEVYCNLFKESNKLDCLRSPHLYKEHAVRYNVSYNNDAEIKRWFQTDGLYTSCHDLISKILQFDVDGDKSLVVADKLLIEIAERNMQNIVPLYYEMAKAPAQIINNDIMYDGMIAAYTGGNIGVISNDITKIWNSANYDIDCVKILCMQNNFVIDYAKTLYKPTPPQEISDKIKQFTKNKLPYFFIYAKDKKKTQVENINRLGVNHIRYIIKQKRLDFSKQQLGVFDYKMLMYNPNIYMLDDIAQEIILHYKKLSCRVNRRLFSENEDYNNYYYIFKKIRQEMLSICIDEKYIVDVLIRQLFDVTKSKNKRIFWNVYGDLVLDNLRNNIKNNYIMCEKCGLRFYRELNEKYCPEHRGYQAIGDKTIVCIDCGKEVAVDPKTVNQDRCNNCYKTYRRKYKAKKEKERRKRKA